jgi:hypothetical protein
MTAPDPAWLAPKDVLDSAVAEFARRRQGELGPCRTEMLDHPVAGWCLRNYLLLTEFPELLGQHEPLHSDWCLKRSYWLRRFASVWAAVAGCDAGLEQSVFHELERLPAEALERWPEIEATAEQDAAQQLQAARGADRPEPHSKMTNR